jgi:hypothetical protein
MTRSSSTQGSNFTYKFKNLLPGTWKLYLAFGEWQRDSNVRRSADVEVNGTGSSLLVLDDFSIFTGIRDSGLSPTRHDHGHTDLHYVIRTFDVMVSGQTWMDVKFSNVLSNRDPIQVSGLGIEYVGP